VLAWPDLAGRSLARLTSGLGSDGRYVGQANDFKQSILVAVRHPYTSSYRLQAVTPAGAVLADWDWPGRSAGHWLATVTRARIHPADETCECWHSTPIGPSLTGIRSFRADGAN